MTVHFNRSRSAAPLSRRVALASAAWSVPVITVATAAPALAVSSPDFTVTVTPNDENTRGQQVIDIPDIERVTSISYVVAAAAGQGQPSGDGAVISGTILPTQIGIPSQLTLIAGQRGKLSSGTVPGAGGPGYGNGGSGGTDFSGTSGTSVSGGSGGGGGSALLLGAYSESGDGGDPLVVAGGGGGKQAQGGQRSGLTDAPTAKDWLGNGGQINGSVIYDGASTVVTVEATGEVFATIGNGGRGGTMTAPGAGDPLSGSGETMKTKKLGVAGSGRDGGNAPAQTDAGGGGGSGGSGVLSNKYASPVRDASYGTGGGGGSSWVTSALMPGNPTYTTNRGPGYVTVTVHYS